MATTVTVVLLLVTEGPPQSRMHLLGALPPQPSPGAAPGLEEDPNYTSSARPPQPLP